MQQADIIRLRHMLDAATEIGLFMTGQTHQSLSDNRMLLLSVAKSLEVIGEAASKVTAEARGELPAMPWAEIVAMRNRLIHAYFDIDVDVVWSTVNDDLPPLQQLLNTYLKGK
jgi:uncharacterized protein with HEPN domain